MNKNSATMSRRSMRSMSKSRSLSPKASIALSGDSGNSTKRSSEGSISPRRSSRKLRLPKSPDVLRYAQRIGRSRTISYKRLKEEEEEDEEPAGAKNKRSIDILTTQQTRDPSAETSDVPENDFHYLKEKTNFPDGIIHKWYNLIKDCTTSGPEKAHYEAHRRFFMHEGDQDSMCISDQDAMRKIKKVYGEENLHMAYSFLSSNYYDGGCRSFSTFMKQLNKTTKATNDLDLKLDLMMYMCRDVDDKRARVYKHKLLEMLTVAANLSLRQQERVARDVESIFDSMRRYMPQTDVLEFVHFRRGIKNGEGRIDINKTSAKYYVLTCVPEVLAAVLAMANLSNRKNKQLPHETWEIISQENAFLERELADKEAESSKAPARTLKLDASSSKGAASSPRIRRLVRIDSNDSLASSRSSVSIMREALDAVRLLTEVPKESINLRRSPRKH